MCQRAGERSRGQILVIAALLIATVFIVLAIILNSAIYSENLSSRSTGTSDQALQTAALTAGGVDSMLDHANRRYNGSYVDLTRNYTRMTDDYGRAQDDAAARQGRSARLARTGHTNGTYLRQTNQSRDYTDASGVTTDWTVAGSVGGVSDYRMVVSRNDLYTDDGVLLSDLLANSFSVHVTDVNGVVWELHVYENTNNEVTVRPVVDGSEQAACEVGAAEVEIDLVAGTVGGAPCPSLTFAEGLDGTLDIEYRDADQIGGTYGLRVDVVVDPGANTHYVERGAGSPSATPNIYATTIEFTYEDSDVSFTSTRDFVAGDVAYEE